MELNKIYNEPCLETLVRMPSKFLDAVITSPPYWQLRDYGYEGQWGLEPTYQQYLEHLWSMMDLIWLKLKDGGTVWINLGDTYSSNRWSNTESGTGISGKYADILTNKNIQEPNKCLLLIPHRFAIGCIEHGWIMRNDCIWAKRNGMPESVTDRFSKKHEYFFFMVKSEKYFFDLDAIRDKALTTDVTKNGTWSGDRNLTIQPISDKNTLGGVNEKGKNPGSVSDFWDIPTKPSSHKHYASYNDELLKKPVLAGCPEGGIIYDPFMGTGSTAEVALRSNRKFIGSEMSANYLRIANDRLNPYLNQVCLF